MAFDWLTEPVSEDAPCGPDLEATDDEKFLDYYFEAESRLPERYFVPSMGGSDEFASGTVFDKKSLVLKDELAQIEPLLKRSRDLRLLSLMARFAILCDNLSVFADALEGIAGVMETFPNDVNPRDQSDRRGALDELGNNTSVLVPLQYAELAGSGGVSVRRYIVAKGETGPREGETGLNPGAIVGELSAPSSKKPVDAAHAALDRAAAALDRIKRACLVADTPFNPDLSSVIDGIKAAQDLIAMGRPDLTPWSAEAAAPEADEDTDDAGDDDAGDDDAGGGDTPAASGPKTIASKPIVVTTLPNRAAATQSLGALERYFATHEPASPALLLVTQARLLIGRPLVEAIQTLLPSNAEMTKIDFGPTTGFVLDMDRLRMLANEGEAMAAEPEDNDPGDMPVIANRNDAAGQLSAVEEFFRAREPASPVPVLLMRARNYLEKDFSAIVAELIPIPPADG